MAGDDDIPFEVGDEIEGRYRVLRIIGSGSAGVVYEVEHLFTGGRAAVKALKELVSDRAERMRQEARTLADIHHPNVVPVTDGGVTAKGVVWFAMPLLEGRTLREEVWRKRALGVERSLRIAIDIGHGLTEVHARGIIHRDLKPENVFLVAKDDSVRVLDFGTSKFQRGNVKTTDRFRIMGTYAYMSPERLQADLVDHRADIFALGHVLYEMLSGMHALSEGPGPLDFPGLQELGLRQIYAQPPPLSERSPDTPAYVAQIVYRALAKDRKKRQESMASMTTDLERAMQRWQSEHPQRSPSAGQVLQPARGKPVVQRAAPAPSLDTEKVSPQELGVLPDAQPSTAASPGAQMRELEADLALGAAQFCSPSEKGSEVLRTLSVMLQDERADTERVANLQTLLVASATVQEATRKSLRMLLATPPDSEGLDTARVALGLREPPVKSEQRMVLLAQGAGACIEPEARLDAAANALTALGRAADDVRGFALGVLIAFSRATEHQQAATRGALIALLLGGPEDTELAHAELARLMIDVADQVPVEPSTTLPEAGARASASLGRSAASPVADAPTSATPNTMSTPRTPSRPAEPPHRRPSLLVALGIAAFCSSAVALVTLVARPASTLRQEEPAPEIRGSTDTSAPVPPPRATAETPTPAPSLAPPSSAPDPERSAPEGGAPSATSRPPAPSVAAVAPAPAAVATAARPGTASPRTTTAAPRQTSRPPATTAPTAGLPPASPINQ